MTRMCAYVAHIASATGAKLRFVIVEAPDDPSAQEQAREQARMGEWVVRCTRRDYCA